MQIFSVRAFPRLLEETVTVLQIVIEELGNDF